MRPKATVHKCAGIIRTWVLFEGGSYMRIEDIRYVTKINTFVLIFTKLKTPKSQRFLIGPGRSTISSDLDGW